MPTFTLERSDGFRQDYRAKASGVKEELQDVLRFLENPGPSHNSLNTHKIEDKTAKREEGVQVWESYITWSHRVTFNYKPNYTIFLRATNGHNILPRRR